jgi:hypothetical protein
LPSKYVKSSALPLQTPANQQSLNHSPTLKPFLRRPAPPPNAKR